MWLAYPASRIPEEGVEAKKSSDRPGLKIHPLEQVLRSAELSKYILDGRKNPVHYAIFTPNGTILPQYLRAIGSIGSRTLTPYPNLQVLKFLMWNSVVFVYNLHISFCIL